MLPLPSLCLAIHVHAGQSQTALSNHLQPGSHSDMIRIMITQACRSILTRASEHLPACSWRKVLQEGPRTLDAPVFRAQVFRHRRNRHGYLPPAPSTRRRRRRRRRRHAAQPPRAIPGGRCWRGRQDHPCPGIDRAVRIMLDLASLASLSEPQPLWYRTIS